MYVSRWSTLRESYRNLIESWSYCDQFSFNMAHFITNSRFSAIADVDKRASWICYFALQATFSYVTITLRFWNNICINNKYNSLSIYVYDHLCSRAVFRDCGSSAKPTHWIVINKFFFNHMFAFFAMIIKLLGHYHIHIRVSRLVRCGWTSKERSYTYELREYEEMNWNRFRSFKGIS